jgi:hypothetical protein
MFHRSAEGCKRWDEKLNNITEQLNILNIATDSYRKKWEDHIQRMEMKTALQMPPYVLKQAT